MLLPDDRQILLNTLQVELLGDEQLPRCKELLDRHHYLKSLQTVGERLHYAVADARGEWVGVLIFTAAARRLRARDKWIGWTDEQRRCRLPLVANNARLLLLPGRTVPNLASAALSRVLDRLSDDWQQRYGHPIVVVETFVDPAHFRGTLYAASNFEELGLTQGCGRKSRDFYERHDRPKRLFVRALYPEARRDLQAPCLSPVLAAVEAKAKPRCTLNSAELESLQNHFRQVPDYRSRTCPYPLHALLSIMTAAHLARPPKGQKDLAAFAQSLSQAQRRALGVRQDEHGRYPAPTQPTFSRLYQGVGYKAAEKVLLDYQTQVRGAPPPDELVAFDGKTMKGSGTHIVIAVAVPSLYVLGMETVADKSNEIIAVRKLAAGLDLDGRCVSVDAMHTQDETARELVQNHGADYFMTVKRNQPTLKTLVEKQVELPPAGPLFCPGQTAPAP